jgi:hypothetical protein
VSRRAALITDSNLHLGRDLARVLAKRSHDLILRDPLPGLVEEVEALGVVFWQWMVWRTWRMARPSLA